MGDHQHRPAAHGLTKTHLHSRFRFGIQRTGGFIEKHHRRIPKNGAGDGNALKLPPGHIGTPLFQMGRVSLREVDNEIVGIGQTGRFHDLLLARRATEANRLGDSA